MYKLLVRSLVATLLFSCGEGDITVAELPKLKVIQAKIVDTVFVSEYIADIHSKQNVEIRSKVNGFLETILVDEGKYVKAGQVLFKLSNQKFEQEVLKSKAALKSAQAYAQSVKLELDNVRKLYESNVVSKAELEKARIMLESALAKVEEAQTEVQSAQINLSLTTIKAPFDGVINRIPLKIGSLIDEGTLLTTLSNNKDVYAYFHVSEKEYLAIMASKLKKSDAEISLLLADNLEHRYKGKLETEEGEFDRSTGNIAFRAKFPNPELLLKHGSTGKVQIERDLDDALIIPQKSTFEIQDKFYVYVVGEDSLVRARNVVVKKRLPHLFVIESGIDTSDLILVEGLQSVNDGVKLNPIKVGFSEVESNHTP